MLAELRKLLGMSDDADETAVLNAARTRLQGGNGNDGDNGSSTESTPATTTTTTTPDTQVETTTTPVPENQPSEQPSTNVPTGQLVSASLPEGAIKLAETDPMVRSLVDRIAILEGATRLSEVNMKLNEIQSSGSYAIAPAVLDEIKTLALECPRQLSDKLLGVFEKVAKGGIVELGERGGAPTGDRHSSSTMQFTDKAEQLAKSKGITLADAMEELATSDPQLWNAYRSESYID